MFDKIKKLFGSNANVNPGPTHPKPEPPPPPPKKPRAPRKQKVVAPPPVLSEKEKATAAGEPYIAITKVDIDPNNINNGGFDLDWNDKFLMNLIRAGYKQKPEDTDDVIIDRWFQTVCRNIALEVFEQEQSDPTNRGTDDVRPPAVKKNLGDGKVEIS